METSEVGKVEDTGRFTSSLESEPSGYGYVEYTICVTDTISGETAKTWISEPDQEREAAEQRLAKSILARVEVKPEDSTGRRFDISEDSGDTGANSSEEVPRY